MEGRQLSSITGFSLPKSAADQGAGSNVARQKKAPAATDAMTCENVSKDKNRLIDLTLILSCVSPEGMDVFIELRQSCYPPRFA